MKTVVTLIGVAEARWFCWGVPPAPFEEWFLGCSV
jgi:hypothetical protein